MSQSVKLEETLSVGTLTKAYIIPSEKCAHNTDDMFVNSDGIKDNLDNANAGFSDQDSEFHHEVKSSYSEQAQNAPIEQQSNNKLNGKTFLFRSESPLESKEVDQSLSVSSEVTDTDTIDNLEHLNDSNDSKSNSFEDSTTEDEQTVESKDLNQILSAESKAADTDSRDNLEQSNGINDSKNKLLDDWVIEEKRNVKSKDLCLSIKRKVSDTDSRDILEHCNDSGNSKSKLSNDVTVLQPETTVESGKNRLSCRQDTRRACRNSKRKRGDAGECCPVCGLTVRLFELENHYAKEVDNLAKIPKTSKKLQAEKNGISTTFVQVKSNRENRLSAKYARYAAKKEVQCPVCKLKILGTPEDIDKHVCTCINEVVDSDMLVVDDDEDSFEEYEFGNETRVRAISFVPGGYKALHGLSSRRKTTDEDENLDVDVDDTMTYGDPQYTEMDVIHTTSNVTENKELEQLRKAVLLDPTVQPQVLETRKWSNDGGKEIEISEQGSSKCSDDSNVSSKTEITEQKENYGDEHSNHIISSLKERLKDFEDQARNVKCLICLEPYTKPVVSTTCWHVYCEECWLTTMGVKKLCPQCNMIVFPSDLRRIYL